WLSRKSSIWRSPTRTWSRSRPCRTRSTTLLNAGDRPTDGPRPELSSAPAPARFCYGYFSPTAGPRDRGGDGMKRRVVVTGIGAVTPIGVGKDALWDALARGVSGIGPITRFDAADYPTRFAGEVRQFDPTEYMDRKDARRLDRFVQYAWAATRMALEDAKLDPARVDGERMGVLIGSGIGGIEVLEQQIRVLAERGPSRVSPFLVPMMIPDMAAGYVSIQTGA